ncbi:MAG: hypothetical protein IKT00_05625 [Prevotella sp.]|nr:hypothetical protein [Prevotella sp.]
MKKVLLLAVAAMMATSGFAQEKKGERTLSQRDFLPRLEQKMTMRTEATPTRAAGPARSAADGLYYNRPIGSFWLGFTADGYGYYNNMVLVAPWDETPFINRATDPKRTEWGIETSSGKVSLQDEADEEYNLPFALPPMAMYYCPTLYTGDGSNSWDLSQNSVYYQRVSSNYTTRILTDSVTAFKATDDHAAYLYNGTYYGPYATWGLLSDNMYGSGIMEEDEYTFTSYRAEQYFGKPQAPIYIENIYAVGSSFSRDPFKEGGKLYCHICGVKDYEARWGTIKVADMDNIIATLVCEPGDTLDFVTEDERNQQTIYEGTLLFTNKQVNAFGNIVEKPVVVNEEFVLAFTGFESDLVDFGIYGLRVPIEDETVENGTIWGVWNDGEEQYVQYSADIAMNVGINGMYVKYNTDIFINPTTGEVLPLTEVRLDAETGEAMDDGGVGFNYVPFTTPTRWFDDQGAPNYEVEMDDDAKEWLGVEVQELVDAEMEITVDDLIAAIIFYADPLPADATVEVNTGSASETRNARYAITHVKGYEVESDPIIVVQGDITIEEAKELAASATGIENVTVVKADQQSKSKIYNLNGQQVNGSYKGIVIRDGKKVINK